MKVNGYAISDDGDILDLFTTLFLDAEEPATLSKADVAKAAEQAARFFVASLDGLHQKLEPLQRPLRWLATYIRWLRAS